MSGRRKKFREEGEREGKERERKREGGRKEREEGEGGEGREWTNEEGNRRIVCNCELVHWYHYYYVWQCYAYHFK